MIKMKDLEYTNTQRDQIRKALDNGDTLTSMDAIHRFHCTKLATRISELKKYGYPVIVEMVHPEEGNPYAKYRRGPGAFIPRFAEMTFNEWRKHLIDTLINIEGVGDELAERMVKEDYDPVCRGYYKCDVDVCIAAHNLLSLYEAEADADAEADGQLELDFTQAEPKVDSVVAEDDVDVQKNWDKLIEMLGSSGFTKVTVINDNLIGVKVTLDNSDTVVKFFTLDLDRGIYECDVLGNIGKDEPAMDHCEVYNYLISVSNND